MTIRELIERAEKEVAVYAIIGDYQQIDLGRQQAFRRMLIEAEKEGIADVEITA